MLTNRVYRYIKCTLFELIYPATSFWLRCKFDTLVVRPIVILLDVSANRTALRFAIEAKPSSGMETIHHELIELLLQQVAHLGWDFTLQLISLQCELLELLHVPELRWNGSCKLIVLHLQPSHVPKEAHLTWQWPRKLTVVQTEKVCCESW